MRIRFIKTPINAGFANPADPLDVEKIDLNRILIKHPTATFFIRVKGDSMVGANICNGDILIVDRSLSVKHKHIVVATIDGDFTIKRILLTKGKTFLEAANPKYPLLEISPEQQFEVWGVVTYIIHQA